MPRLIESWKGHFHWFGLDEENTMHVTVDNAKCDGFGFCEQAAPDLFVVDEDGYARVLVENISEHDVARVETAIRACPVAALKATL